MPRAIENKSTIATRYLTDKGRPMTEELIMYFVFHVSPLSSTRATAHWRLLQHSLKHSLNDFINSTCKYLLRITRLTLSFLLTSIFFTIWHNKKHLFFSRSCILTLRKCRVNRLSDFRIKGIIANYWAIFKQKYSIVHFLSSYCFSFFLSNFAYSNREV